MPRTKALLWSNLSALMQRHWGRENLRRLAREAGIGPGGATRLKDPDPEASVRVAMLEDLASLFGVEPWQLIAPDLGENLYVIDDERRLNPVYQPPVNVVQLPEPSRGGLRKTAEQKERYAARTSQRAAKKRTG